MTVLSELPAWAVDRVADAVMRAQGYSEDDIDFYGDRPSVSTARRTALETAAAAIAAVLAIIEERAGPGWLVFVPGGIDTVDPDEGTVTVHEVPLAELLGEKP